MNNQSCVTNLECPSAEERHGKEKVPQQQHKEAAAEEVINGSNSPRDTSEG